MRPSSIAISGARILDASPYTNHPIALAAFLTNEGGITDPVVIFLKREGIEPAPGRGQRTPWSVFLKAHWRSVVAADFFTVEVWTLNGLITHYVLFVIALAKRLVHIVGITTHPDDA